jgi:hypothetical protein
MAYMPKSILVLYFIVNQVENKMPFASIQYRNLRNSTLNWQERRKRFLCITLSYAAIILIAGFVFLGLYFWKRNWLDGYNCSNLCSYYGTPYSCGYQQCCDSPNGYNSNYYNSFMFCMGDYMELIYFIIMICCFSYVLYELLTICCIVCTASALQDSSNVVVMNNGGPYVGLATNYGSPYNNDRGNYPPDMRNPNQNLSNNPMNQGNLAPNPLNTNKNANNAKVIINEDTI